MSANSSNEKGRVTFGVLHGIPPESAYIQRLRAEVVERRARLTSDTAVLHAQMEQVDIDHMILAGSLLRLEQAQALTDTDAKDTPL